MDKAVLIAHYNRSLDWLQRIDRTVPVIVYTSNPGVTKYRQVRNRGHDAPMYLQFILDHWDKLPERTVFCHHHETDWTQEHPLSFIINHLNWQAGGYFSIGAQCNYWTAIPYPEKPYHEAAMRRSWPLLEPYLPWPERLTYIAGTQFCANRDLIRQYPKEFYESCLAWVYSTAEAEWFIGRFFEYTWHYILTRDPIEKKQKYLL